MTVESGACHEPSETRLKEVDSVDGVTVSGPGRTETEMVCWTEPLGAMALSSAGALDALGALGVPALGSGSPCPLPVSLTETLSGASGAATAACASAPPSKRSGTTTAAVPRAAPNRRFRHPGCMPRGNAHQGYSFVASP